MAVTQNSYIGNGTTTTYSFTFPYLKSTDVKASIDATVTTAFTQPTATTVQFNTAPANGAKIKIYRETDSDDLTATFYAGSAIKSEDLNDNFTQNLYATQEVTARYLSNLGGTMVGDLTMAEDVDIVFEGATDDAYETTLTVADPTADRVITLPNVTGTVVTTGDTGSIATAMIADNAISTAKIANDSVTVAKIADGAARQVLQTAANGSDVEWTDNVDLPGTLDVTGNTTLDGTLNVTGNSDLGGTVSVNTIEASVKFDGGATKIITGYGDHNANWYVVGVHPYTNSTGVVPRTNDSFQFHGQAKKVYGGFDLDLSGTSTYHQAYSLQAKKPIHLIPNSTEVPTVKWWELTANGSDYVGIKGPNDVTGGSYTVTLPASSPGADKVLKTGSSGSETTLVWGDAPSASALSAAATVTLSESNEGITPDDVTYFTTAASDARYYNIGTTEEIQSGETWVADDTKVATTSAIDNRIVDLVDDVGGFVPLVDEGEIPQYHPEKENTTTSDRVGTILSIGTLTTTYTPSGGTCTIQASDLTNHSVNATITDCGSTVLAAGFGVLVETTAQTNAQYAAGPAFKFHRLVPKATEVTTVAGKAAEITTCDSISANITTVAGISANVTTVATNNTNVTNVGGSIANVNTVAGNLTNVNNFADLYQIASSDPGTDGGGNALADGDLYFNSSGNELKVYNGSAWQGGVTATGNLVSKSGDTLTGDLVLDNAKEIRLSETDANGSHYLGFKAPDSVTANVTLTLPDGAGSNGQYLKTNGSDTLSWSSVDLSAYAPLAGATFTGAIAAPSATFTDDGASQVVQIKTDDGAVYALRISNDTYSTNSLVGLRVYQEDDGDITLSHRGDSEYRQFWISQSDGTTTRPLYGGSTGGAAYLYHAGSSKLNTTASGITVTGSVTDDKGDVRNVPKNYKTSAYTLLASDAGKCITTEANVTIDPNVMSDGDVVTIVNNTTSNISIIRGTNVILHNSADATDSNKTLAGRGMCTMWFMNSAHAYITGAGLT